MCDSIILYLSIEHVLNSSEANFPYKVRQTVTHYGEVVHATGVTERFQSPLTGAEFLVTPVFKAGFARAEDLIGYLLSVNVPACVTGNNALPMNLVYWACMLSLELLKYSLIFQGADPDAVQQLSLECAQIREVTFTYLQDCDVKQKAIARVQDIYDYGQVTRNLNHTNPKQKKPVIVFSSGGLSTVTITNHRLFEGKFYVKEGPTPKSFETFPNAGVKSAIYAESGKMGRDEFKATANWLKANDAVSPLKFKNRAEANRLYERGYTAMAAFLRTSDNLRSRRPKPEHMNVLTPTEKEVLTDYFTGVDPSEHELMKGKSQQYFSLVKRNIEKALRIDISIPWSLHSTKISPTLPQLFQYPGEYQPAAHLADYCFTRETAKLALVKLRQMVKSVSRAQSISLTKTSPPPTFPAPVSGTSTAKP